MFPLSGIGTYSICQAVCKCGDFGQIIAFYEHVTFVEGTIWGIDSFDQWGVELGKQLAKALLPKVQGEQAAENHDSSTQGLVKYYLANKA